MKRVFLAVGIWVPLVLMGFSSSLRAQVSDPFGKSVTEQQKSGPSLILGDGTKKALPSLDKGGKKGGAAKSGAVEDGVTEITAKDRLVFDQKGNQAVFVGDVVVLDSRFSLNCDKLTAVMKRSMKDVAKDVVKEESAEKGGGEKAGGEKAGAAKGGGGIEKAIAEGHVVIAQEKRNDKGELERSVGRGQKVIYDADTGDITLSGWPQVEQKMNTIVALEEGTVIVLNRKGTMDVQGHSKTVLRNTKIDDGR
ncbi:MAG: LptA/OstA family protein [Verrucomicrobiota bacterium]